MCYRFYFTAEKERIFKKYKCLQVVTWSFQKRLNKEVTERNAFKCCNRKEEDQKCRNVYDSFVYRHISSDTSFISVWFPPEQPWPLPWPWQIEKVVLYELKVVMILVCPSLCFLDWRVRATFCFQNICRLVTNNVWKRLKTRSRQTLHTLHTLHTRSLIF